MERKGWSHTMNSFPEPEDANADEERDYADERCVDA
jgi:hypothetical protein